MNNQQLLLKMVNTIKTDFEKCVSIAKTVSITIDQFTPFINMKKIMIPFFKILMMNVKSSSNY